MSRGARRAFPSLCNPPPRLVVGVLAAALACHAAWGQTAPSVSSISLNSAGADNTYGIGDEIEASITFSEVVHVFEGEVAGVQRGELHLLLAIGAATRQAQFCGGSGSATLRFCYEVRSGDEDTDGISIGRLAIALVDGVIESATGTGADRDFAAQAADATRLVDGVPPAPGTPTLNTPATGDTYGVGETIEATVTFNEAVNVIEDNAVGQLQLALSIGRNTRLANYATGSGTANLLFTYVVQADDEDTDGISIASGGRSLTGGGITDAAGNAAGRNFNALGQSANHKVDGGSDFAGPTVTDVRVSSTPGAAGAYATGQTIEVTVTFNEVVQVAGSPAITLTVGATARSAAYHAGDGTTALVFRYTVQAGETDANGVSIPAGPAALAGGTIQDGAGNAADRTFARLANQPLHEVDAVAPTVVGNVRITSSPATGNTYAAGETITAEIVFNENIVATGRPALEIAVGSASRQAAGTRAATLTTMVFSYTVAAGDQDTDGITIAAGPGSLTGGAITDAQGNPVSRAFAGLPTAQGGHRVDGGPDGVAPTVSAVRMDSNAGVDQTYALGDAIRVAIEFNEVVYVPRNARPQLALSIGTPDSASAAYHDGSGTNTLIFRYVVVAGDADADGISIGTLASALTGGTIVDGAGNDAVRSHAGLATQTDHRVEARAPRVTTTGPAVVITSDPDATGPDDDTYNHGDVIRITVTFDEVVHVTTSPQLAVTIGPATRQARYAAGSGTETLEFRYTVQLGEVDADGISVNPNSLTGGRIQDAVGNDAVRTFTGLPASSEHLVDGGAGAAAPMVQTVRVSSNPNTGAASLTPNTYAGGDNIEVEVTFDQIVHVTGSPAIILALGDRDQGAAYHRGSGTVTLTFRYQAREGDVDTDGIGIGPGPRALSGGVIVDSAGTAAVRTFTGLPRQDTHLVDATSPTVTDVRITSSPGPDNLYTIGESLTGTVTFSEEVFADNAEIELLIGDSGASPVRRVPLTTGMDRRVLHFTYAVQRGDSDDGVSIGPDGLVGGVIRDDAGNPARRRFAGLEHRTGAAVDGGQDNVAPTVLSVAASSDPGADYRYAIGDHIEVAVAFSEVVHVSGNPQLALTVGSATRQAAYHRGSGTTRLVFRHTVLSNEEDDDGFAIGAGPGVLSGGGIHDSAGNAANRMFAEVGRLAGHRVDAVPPRTTSPNPLDITSNPNADDAVPPDTYETGDVIRVTATFDEAVRVQGAAPNLTLTTTNGLRQARYISGSDSTVLTFEYTVLRGDQDADGISIAANALSCDDSPAAAPLRCLVDAAGNPASHVVPGLAADIDHKVDGNTLLDGPFIAYMGIVSNPGTDQTYAAGDQIEVEIRYRTDNPGGGVAPSPVFVSGSPTLTLVLGSRERPAALKSGNGTNKLTFAYTVEPGDEAPDGLAFPRHPRDKIELRGGTIQDAAGHTAYRVFEPGSVMADVTELTRHKVDGVAPRVASVAIISDPGADDTYKRGEDIRVQVRFSEGLRVTDTPDLTLDLLIGERRRAARRTASRRETMTFTYTVQDGDSDADGVSIEADALRGGEIVDLFGNEAILSGVALGDQRDHLVDGAVAGAVVRIASDAGPDQTYGIGDTIAIEVLFDDSSFIASPTLRLLLQVGVAIREAELVTASDRLLSTRLLTFEYTVQEGDSDADGISIDNDALRDADPSARPPALAPLPNQAAHRVDAVPPGVAEVEIASTPANDDTYRQGELIRVTVTFNEVVHVTGTPGFNPGLTLAIGERFPTARYRGGSGTRTLSFHYRVQGGDLDDNGISIGPDALVGGRIEDGAGNDLAEAARRLRPIPQDAAHKVDGGVDDTAPTIDGVYITSTPRAGTTYAAGEVIEVQVVFSEAVNVREVDIVDGVQVEVERPVLELDLTSSGTPVSRSARLAPEDDASDTLTFRYTVRDGDFDSDGVAIPANALTGGTITDYRGSGNTADRNHDAVPPNRDHQIDAARPRVVDAPEIYLKSKVPSEVVYGLGDPIVLRVHFNEPVHVAGEPVLRLSIGRQSRDALFAKVHEGRALEFHYIVQSGDEDNDGVSIGPDALRGGTIQDAVGNMWVDRRLPAFTPAADEYRVDGKSDFLAPVVTDVTFESPERTYRLNDNIDVGVIFNEAVFVVAGAPTLRLSIGAELRAATYRTGSGSNQLHFRYVVQPGDSDPDGISIGPNALSGGTVQDEAGNDAVLAFVGVAQQPSRKVDPNAEEMPKVTAAPQIASRPAAGYIYRAGENIDVNMTFSKAVHVSGQVSLLLSIGPNVRPAAYASGSGTNKLTFRYTVRAGDQDDNGISIGPGPAALAGGVISDGSGNFALRNFYPLSQDGRHKVDGVPPAATAAPTILSEPATRETYKVDEHIDVQVRFGEKVWASRDLVLALRIGTTRRDAALIGVRDDTETLTFRYTVRTGDLDEDGVSVATDALQGGTIMDAVRNGNAAVRALPVLLAQSKHKVDGVIATAAVAIASSPETGDTYRAGESIDLNVTFSETVEIADAADLKLALTIGDAVREADFVRLAEDERTLSFRYTVAFGDFDADGVAVRGEALAGGTAADLAGNPVRRTLTLADQGAHKVNTSVTRDYGAINLKVGGTPMQLVLTDVLAYTGLYNAPTTSDANVAVAQVSGHRLTITPVAEGAAVITVTAQTTAQITLNFPVVVTASAVEIAVVTHSLAAMGRGMLASAAHTIGSRLELGPGKRRMSLLVGGRRFDPRGPEGALPSAPVCQPQPAGGLGRAGFGGGCDLGPPGSGHDALWPHTPRQAGGFDGAGGGFGGWPTAGRGMWRNSAFEMPLLGVGRGGDWSLWGGGDFSSFSGEPASNSYEGNLSAVYVGMDGRGDGWVAGGAFGRVSAEADYEYEGVDSSGKGALETSLTTFHPYVGWSPSDKAKAWVVLGFGRGEASMQRENQQYDATPTDLSMRMGLVGARGTIGEPGGFDVSLRADAGTLSLETGSGLKAIDALEVAVQRVRLGMEFSYTSDSGPVVGGVRLSDASGGGGGKFTPFLEVAARFDGGDGQGGTGAEVAAGLRYQSTAVSFEAKARTLAMQGDEEYSETGASATLVVAPGGDGGRGLRMSVSPRWGGASDATDVFFARDYAARAAQRHKNGAAYDEWRMNARVGYAMPLRGRAGTVTPFAETDVAGAGGKRARVGFSYETKAGSGSPVRFDVSGERVRDERGTEHRVLLGAQGRF